MIKYRKYIENLNRKSNLYNLIIMSNKITTIDIPTSTRDRLRKICKEEGRTYDGQLRWWMNGWENKKKRMNNGK